MCIDTFVCMYKVHLHGDSKGKSDGKYNVTDIDDTSDMGGFIAKKVFLDNPQIDLKPNDWSDHLLPKPLHFVCAMGKNGKKVDLAFLNKSLKLHEDFRVFMYKICTENYPEDNPQNEKNFTSGPKTPLGDLETALGKWPEHLWDRADYHRQEHPGHIACKYLRKRSDEAFRKISLLHHPDQIGDDTQMKLFETCRTKIREIFERCAGKLQDRDEIINKPGYTRPIYHLMPLARVQAIADATLLREFGDGVFVSDTLHPVSSSVPLGDVFGKERCFSCNDFEFYYAECK